MQGTFNRFRARVRASKPNMANMAIAGCVGLMVAFSACSAQTTDGPTPTATPGEPKVVLQARGESVEIEGDYQGKLTKTDTFSVGAEWQVAYTCSYTGLVDGQFMQVSVYRKDGQHYGGAGAVTCPKGSNASRTSPQLGAGEFYLEVLTAPGVHWELTVTTGVPFPFDS